MKTRKIEQLSVQRIYDVHDDLEIYEIMADGSMIADISLGQGQRPKLVIFATAQALEVDAAELLLALRRIFDSMQAPRDPQT